MPYQINNPPAIIAALPKHAQRIWINAFNSAFTQNKSEKVCMKIAWAAIKMAGYSKNSENKWGRWED